jgi:hypothetical protein
MLSSLSAFRWLTLALPAARHIQKPARRRQAVTLNFMSEKPAANWRPGYYSGLFCHNASEKVAGRR